MKVFAIVFLALFAIAAANIHGNGRPGCQTQEELTVRDWRNLHDPTAFWRCTVLGQAAAPVRCEDEGYIFGFMSGRGCVDWDEWVWQPAVLPPSLA